MISLGSLTKGVNFYRPTYINFLPLPEGIQTIDYRFCLESHITGVFKLWSADQVSEGYGRDRESVRKIFINTEDIY